MVNDAVFSAEEWSLLVRLPKWVAQAASQAQADRGRRTSDEEEAGFIAVGQGRQSGDALVQRIASEAFDTFDDVAAGDASIDFADPEAGLATVLAQAQTAARLLRERTGTAGASAYRRWISAIAETVVGAARSGDLVGIGGETVSRPERAFLDRLAHALQA